MSDPVNSVPAPYLVPQPSLGRTGGGAVQYTNTFICVVPTNPETGYLILSGIDSVQPPPGPVPVYETIKMKDTRPDPPVRPDGNGMTRE